MVSMLVTGVIILLVYIIVAAGSLAYELTGLDRQTARFQALSAFTGTGFTTRAAELVVRHGVRRRITAVLMVMGYAGTASAVASLLSSFTQNDYETVLRNLAFLVGGFLISFPVVSRLGRPLGDWMRRVLTVKLVGESVPHEELLLYKRGYGITRIEVPAGSRVEGKALRELDLRRMKVQVLAVEEHNDVHPIPDPSWTFEAGQHLIVYGSLADVQKAFGQLQAAEQEQEAAAG